MHMHTHTRTGTYTYSQLDVCKLSLWQLVLTLHQQESWRPLHTKWLLQLQKLLHLMVSRMTLQHEQQLCRKEQDTGHHSAAQERQHTNEQLRCHSGWSSFCATRRLCPGAACLQGFASADACDSLLGRWEATAWGGVPVFCGICDASS